MSNNVIEIAEIRLAEGRTVQDLLAASERFQNEFLSAQPGFIGRDLVRTDDGSYADIVRWDSVEAATAIMDKAANSEACQRFFAVMEMNSQDPTEGVNLYEVLTSYPAAGSRNPDTGNQQSGT